jgi:AGCS family alanine or glycine:cation symporter
MNGLFSTLNDGLNVFMGWPIIAYVITIGVICTITLSFMQFRFFAKAWQLTLLPPKTENNAKKSDMSPLQAFINTLNISVGNGSLAGMATAIFSGGPGAALWIVLISFLLMPIRYAEVYLSTYFAAHAPAGTQIGGPMLYLRVLKGGRYLAYLYAFFCMCFGFIVGCGMQANSISVSVKTTFEVPLLISAIILAAFALYVNLGGAQRVVKLSEKIVPFKVGLFFITATALLVYHYQAIIPSLHLIITSGLSNTAFMGGILGFTVQQAMRYGIIRSINATESGLGTAAILFGSTGSVQPVKDGIMSMASTFVSMLVCFMVALCIIASGVWSSGLTSTALTIAAYNTLFGYLGGWIVTILSISFGIGVLVSYTYITKAAWDSLVGRGYSYVFMMIFVACAFFGAQIDVTKLWSIVDISNATMLIINLLGILVLLPLIKRDFKSYARAQAYTE